MQSASEVMQFRVSLREITPEVWRRFQVPSTYTFWDLHVAIQDAMGWNDSHLHAFEVGGATIGIPDPDAEEDRATVAGWTIPLHRYFKRPGAHAEYLYDFGDDWQHTVVLEAVLLPEKGARYPLCIGGERACPPDDVGGPSGYSNLLEALADEKHPQHSELKQWVGGAFESDRFDASEVVFEDPRKRLRDMMAGE